MKEQNRQIYSFDKFRLDAENRQLRRGDKPLSLPPKAFDLLVALVENNGRLVGKDELLTNVWRDQFVEESNLTVQVSQIRKVLGETKDKPQFIETIPGYGYRFIGDVSNLEDEELVIETETLSRITIENESEPLAPTGGLRPAELQIADYKLQAENHSPQPTAQKPFFLIISAVVALLAVAGGGFWFFNRKPENRGINAPVNAAEKQPKMRRLTSKGRVNIAVLSPDGNFFAYSIYERGSYRTEIRLGHTNGSSDVALIPKAEAVYNPTAFSADGTWLYYVQSKERERTNGTLYKIPVLGGVSQKLVSGISIYPSISPDEKQIAFVRDNSENKTSTLVIVNLDGTGERELVVRPLTQAIRSIGLSWTNDASLIAFTAKNGEDDKREIFTADTATGSVTQITAFGSVEVAKLEWLKDGSGLLAVIREKEAFSTTQIFQVDYPSGTVRKLVSDLAQYGSALSISADSSAFVAVQVNSESNIWTAPADNLKEAKQITFGSLFRQDGWFGLDWTPDGRIVYAARVDRSLTLWVMDATGENVRQLTPNGTQDRTPTVSADGQYVVFESHRSETSEIWRVRLDGGDLTQLTTDGGNSAPSFTSDSQSVIYQHNGSDGESSVRQIPLAGGEFVRLIDKKTSSPRVSPDGKFIACGLSADGKTKLAIFSIEGGEPLKLFDVPPTYNFDIASIRWSADAKFIAYRDWAKGIWRQSVDGGEPKLLENLPTEKFFPFDWSPDGKQFAFTRGREGRDVVLISDFKSLLSGTKVALE